ncbi:PAS domain-containing sensor histidine kinase, partial [Patescibacteria group bacterium]|nr:PAS domain-containing sensor histidine kinase [Patescibacteria group bacterium]
HAFQFMDVAQARIIFDNKNYQTSQKLSKFLYKIEEPIVVAGRKRGILQVGYTKKLAQMKYSPFWHEERKLVKSITLILGKHIASREVLESHKKIVTKSIRGIYIATDGILRYANPMFCKMFGTNKHEAIGKPITHFVDGFNCSMDVKKSSKFRISKCSGVGKRKNGTLIDLDIAIQRIDHHGKPAVLGRLHDITLIKRAERKLRGFNAELKKLVDEKTHHLERANKRLQSLNEMKDEFIAVTSHELRSPLTSIRGYLSFLVEKESLESFPDAIKQYLLRAYHNTESLNYLVNNILDVSRLDLGRFELQRTPTDLIKLVKDIIDSLSYQASEKKLKIKFSNLSKSKNIALKIDVIRISQVLRNLLDNAIKFSKRSKDILVTIKKRNGFAVIEIADQGVGIPKAKIDEIFDKFIQVKNIDTRYKGGAGLGLFISKRIIELHGGIIEATSQKSKGAVFTIQLPLKQEEK